MQSLTELLKDQDASFTDEHVRACKQYIARLEAVIQRARKAVNDPTIKDEDWRIKMERALKIDL